MTEPAKSKLNLNAVVGFGGKVANGLVCHPDGEHIIYPLGSTIVVKNVVNNTQAFLQGHTDKVSCLALSNSGMLLASGQSTHMGFKADVIVWDLMAAIRNANVSDEGEIIHRLSLHKVKVQDLAFSPSDKFLCTLGGQDDNNIVVWNVEAGEAICGSPAGTDSGKCVSFFNHDDYKIVSGGNYHVRVWDFDRQNRKLHPLDCHLGQLKRIAQVIAIDDSDTVAYVGTVTGDLLEVNVVAGKFVKASRQRFSQGIICIATTADSVLVGTGDGTLARLDKRTLKVQAQAKLQGKCTSVAIDGGGSHLFAGTDQSTVYYADCETLSAQLRSTCHFERINDICFPRGFSHLFVTASVNDIRVWNAASRQELLRIQVPNLQCHSVIVSPSGNAIISGWDDGKIRAFYPQSGKLMFVITDAHADGVTSLACTHDGERLISGGSDGRVRVWNLVGARQTMICSLKEHRGAVTSIFVRKDNSEACTASEDGSCIVWDLSRFTRNNCLFASTMFQTVLYHPDESQLLTCGTDRKITYWDAFDGNTIRIIEGSEDEIMSIDIEPDGVVFVSGGNDKVVRVWDYDDGGCIAEGVGHSGGITCVKISPDQKTIVSCGTEGAIFVWTMPAAGARDLAAEGYVAKAGVEDEVDDAAYALQEGKE